MWEKAIIYSNIQHCFAQIEEIMVPELKHMPLVIKYQQKGQERVLDTNDLARQYRIQQGDTIQEAYRKCSQLMVVEAHYEDYFYYLEEVKNIYREYSDEVEESSQSGAYIDLSSSFYLFGGDPVKIAHDMQKRIFQKLGLKVTMGLSFQKLYAKMAYQLAFNDTVNVISYQNYKQVLFPLSVEKLPYVGKALALQFNEKGIYTIGDIAQSQVNDLKTWFGKKGELLWHMICHDSIDDRSLVKESKPQSIGHRLTTHDDIVNYDDAMYLCRHLVKNIVIRLEDYQLKGSLISIQMRDSEFNSYGYQLELTFDTNDEDEIMAAISTLLKTCFVQSKNGQLKKSYCSIMISVRQLVDSFDEWNETIDTNENQLLLMKKMIPHFHLNSFKNYFYELSRF